MPGNKKEEYAGFWRRLGAMVIDLLIISAGGTIFLYLIGGMDSSISLENQDRLEKGISLFALWLYMAFMESSSKQASLGKLALGIKVTDLKGERIDFGRATGRHFSKIISTIILLIGFLMVIWTEKKQGLHDIISGCVVVRK